MSSGYDMEPVNSPPWWPGLIGLVVIAVFWLAYLFLKY